MSRMRKLYHGTDARAAGFIRKEGLRGGSYVTDSVRSAEHYAKRSAGVRAEMLGGRREGAIVVIEVQPYELNGGGLDPDNPLPGRTWQLARAVRPVEIIRVRCPTPTHEERIWHQEVEQGRYG
jgi:hypothetical protein